MIAEINKNYWLDEYRKKRHPQEYLIKLLEENATLRIEINKCLKKLRATSFFWNY